MIQELPQISTYCKKKCLRVALVTGLAMTVQIWAALQWPANFDSDEAVFGLMALHTLEGQPPTYMYGGRYLGSFESLLSANFLHLFGNHVLALRAGNVILFGVFLILHYSLTCRLWGDRIALLSSLILALPSQRVLVWTFRPIGAFGAMFVSGTGVLLLSLVRISSKALHYTRLVIIGILIGLGVWSHHMTMIYFSTLGVVYWLQTPEWATLYKALLGFFQNRVAMSLRKLAPIVVIGLSGLVVLAFFSSGCEPRELFTTAQHWARASLLGIGACLAAALYQISKRRKSLLMNSAVLGVGFLAGNFFQWKTWVFSNTSPSSAIQPSCPTGILTRGMLIGGQLIPAMWGIEGTPTSIFELPSLSNLLPMLVIAIMTCALLVFAWTQRAGLRLLVTLSPIAEKEQKVLVPCLLFWIPLILALLGGNTLDVGSVRYLLISWQANSVIFALFLVRLHKRHKIPSLVILAIWGLQIVASNYVYLNQKWSDGPYETEAVSSLENLLHQNGASAGYADYWLAYTLDFLTEERLIIAPYNGYDRYPEYSETAAAFPIQAYILPTGAISGEESQVDDLIAYLIHGEKSGGTVFPQILASLADRSVLKRQAVANWDVWIVGRSPIDLRNTSHPESQVKQPHSAFLNPAH
jgi:hypothetical protein